MCVLVLCVFDIFLKVYKRLVVVFFVAVAVVFDAVVVVAVVVGGVLCFGLFGLCA